MPEPQSPTLHDVESRQPHQDAICRNTLASHNGFLQPLVIAPSRSVVYQSLFFLVVVLAIGSLFVADMPLAYVACLLSLLGLYLISLVYWLSRLSSPSQWMTEQNLNKPASFRSYVERWLVRQSLVIAAVWKPTCYRLVVGQKSSLLVLKDIKIRCALGNQHYIGAGCLIVQLKSAELGTLYWPLFRDTLERDIYRRLVVRLRLPVL